MVKTSTSFRDLLGLILSTCVPLCLSPSVLCVCVSLSLSLSLSLPSRTCSRSWCRGPISMKPASFPGVTAAQLRGSSPPAPSKVAAFCLSVGKPQRNHEVSGLPPLCLLSSLPLRFYCSIICNAFYSGCICASGLYLRRMRHLLLRSAGLPRPPHFSRSNDVDLFLFPSGPAIFVNYEFNKRIPNTGIGGSSDPFFLLWRQKPPSQILDVFLLMCPVFLNCHQGLKSKDYSTY